MPIFQQDFAHYQCTCPKLTSHSTSSIVSRNADLETVKASNDTEKTEPPETEILKSSRLCRSHLIKSDESSIPFGASRDDVKRLKKGDVTGRFPNENLKIDQYRHDQTILQSPGLEASSRIPENCTPTKPFKDDLLSGLHIEESQSALHSGDFTDGAEPSTFLKKGALSSAEPVHGDSSICFTSQSLNFSLIQREPLLPSKNLLEFDPLRSRSRLRAPSLSFPYSSNYILKTPTSPLAQSQVNQDSESLSILNPLEINPRPPIYPRRHTLQATYPIGSPLSSLKRDLLHSQPNQKNLPTALCSPFCLMSASALQSHSSHSKSVSISDCSQFYHASMVGSYEESILHGRMSTTPSKPLRFIAQIGVLGTGECKPQLRCPSHLTIPFPAVFYSYETTVRGQISESNYGPSPYVGLIDLENNIISEDNVRDAKRKRSIHKLRSSLNKDLSLTDRSNTCQSAENQMHRVKKKKHSSATSTAPPGGSYRIPKTGQIQIIIKNPNKTAVKLFLVPYDLTGMQPGTKTFIRQRSYSVGPIFAKPVDYKTQSILPKSSDTKILRYLVHLQICSPSCDRFYLYKSIRVVFASRVPDGKEKLMNEVLLPEPRFNTYKPSPDFRPFFDANRSSNSEEKSQ